jgi:hypothetical protein
MPVARDAAVAGRIGSAAARRRGRQRSWAGGLTLLLGVLILWLALPRLLASALLAARDPVIERMAAGERVAATELLGLLASRELALGWVEERETHNERGTALTSLAFEQAESAGRRAMLERAADAIRAGLAVAPADPRDWMQLGYLLVLLEGDVTPEAARAFLFSIRTGAFQAPDVLHRRLFWTLAHWTFYDEEERRQVCDQIRLAWRAAPGVLADVALYRPEFLAPIVSALEAVPAAEQRFLAAIAFATPLPAAP